jgi:hypothetical protein
MSQRQTYGPSDLGRDGICSFFQRHTCSQLCRGEWTRPKIVGRAVYPMREGTSMIAELPTRHDRIPLSRLQGVEEEDEDDSDYY